MAPVRGEALGAAFALLAALSCSSGSAVLKTAPANASPDCAEKLQVFTSREEVTRPYESLCMVDAQTSGVAGNKGNINLVLNKGKKRACECGAEALIVTKLEPVSTGMGGAMITGVAIRFTGPAAPAK